MNQAPFDPRMIQRAARRFSGPPAPAIPTPAATAASPQARSLSRPARAIVAWLSTHGPADYQAVADGVGMLPNAAHMNLSRLSTRGVLSRSEPQPGPKRAPRRLYSVAPPSPSQAPTPTPQPKT